jgi:hypothetical protein
MRHFISACLLCLVIISCTPTTNSTPQVSFQPEAGNRDDFKFLLSPFLQDLQNMSIDISEFQIYRYEGEDPNAFIQATNQFYLTNPGFCPLDEGAGFFVSDDGLIFLTLASNNTSAIKGFLYDQSRRPKLKYAYFSGTSRTDLMSIICETAKATE